MLYNFLKRKRQAGAPGKRQRWGVTQQWVVPATMSFPCTSLGDSCAGEAESFGPNHIVNAATGLTMQIRDSQLP